MFGFENKGYYRSDELFCFQFVSFDLFYLFLFFFYREGSVRGFGIRVSQSREGSDSWVDDPITRHIVGVYINKEEERENNLMWPLALHIKGPYCVLILPLVEPRHVKAYARLCKRSDCGNAVTAHENLSSLLLDLPSITGYGKLLATYLVNVELYSLLFSSFFINLIFSF